MKQINLFCFTGDSENEFNRDEVMEDQEIISDDSSDNDDDIPLANFISKIENKTAPVESKSELLCNHHQIKQGQ